MEWDGLPKELQLDDHEASTCMLVCSRPWHAKRLLFTELTPCSMPAQTMLMQAWVRTGFFADELALQHLDVAVVPISDQVRCTMAAPPCMLLGLSSAGSLQSS